MWDRKELKAKGKAAYRANRITCILAALLLMIASGAGFGGTGASTSMSRILDDDNSSITQNADDYFDDYDDIGDYDDADDYDDIDEIPELSGDSSIPPVVAIIFGIVLLVVLVVSIALSIFLLNPLAVGLRKFFVDNATDHTTGLTKKNVGLAFSGNYKRVVGSMFTTGLFTALWTLLFIIPGIYKAYCWRMVPFIISEDPTITGSEARARSAQMMNGSKWAAFVLDLSFFGWMFLGVFTLGILNLVFTNPYICATDAELYLTLSGRPTMIDHSAPVQEGSQDVIVEFDQEGVSE